MPKVKPILIFIIASVALHWWILSLPIFKRIHLLESNAVKTSSPTLVAYLDQTKPLIKSPEKEKTQSQSTRDNNPEDLNKIIQQPPPPPPFLRGSPWSRRAIEAVHFNSSVPPQQNPLVQIENSVPEDISIGNFSGIRCKRNIDSDLFSCQSPNNKALSDKVADTLNRKALEANLALPNCITLEFLQNKWHAKACHS